MGRTVQRLHNDEGGRGGGGRPRGGGPWRRRPDTLRRGGRAAGSRGPGAMVRLEQRKGVGRREVEEAAPAAGQPWSRQGRGRGRERLG